MGWKRIHRALEGIHKDWGYCRQILENQMEMRLENDMKARVLSWFVGIRVSQNQR